MIYLEIVELNFCKLNYNLRKYINERSDNDSFEDDNRESIINDNDDDKSEENIELSLK